MKRSFGSVRISAVLAAAVAAMTLVKAPQANAFGGVLDLHMARCWVKLNYATIFGAIGVVSGSGVGFVQGNSGGNRCRLYYQVVLYNYDTDQWFDLSFERTWTDANTHAVSVAPFPVGPISRPGAMEGWTLQHVTISLLDTFSGKQDGIWHEIDERMCFPNATPRGHSYMCDGISGNGDT